jgi:hypothetical protein
VGLASALLGRHKWPIGPRSTPLCGLRNSYFETHPPFPNSFSTLSFDAFHLSNVAAHGILNCTNPEDAGVGLLHVAQRFELFLETYRRPDGGRWSGQQLDVATGGVVTRSYVTNLRKGRIENPGYEKMLAMARAMGFPPEA